MGGKGGMLRDVEAGNRSLIRYLVPQLELESDTGPAPRGGRQSGQEDGTEAG